MSADLHLVLRADRSLEGHLTYTLEAVGSWNGSQARWRRLDDKRLSLPADQRDDHFYLVRSMDDPKFRHLMPKLYASPQGAAKALAHHLDPHGKGARPRFYLLDLLDLRTGRDGWANVAKRLEERGYLRVVREHAFDQGRAYLMPTAHALTPRSPMQVNW